MAKIFVGRRITRSEILENLIERPNPSETLIKFLEEIPQGWLLFDIHQSDLKPLSGYSWRGYRAVDPETGELAEYTVSHIRA